MGVDVRQPIALGDGSEERHQWDRIVERLGTTTAPIRKRAMVEVKRGADAMRGRFGDDDSE